MAEPVTEKKKKRLFGLGFLLDDYTERKRKWLENDSKMSFGKYTLRMSLIAVFLVVDFLGVPSFVVYLSPGRLEFVLLLVLILLPLFYAEKKVLDAAAK